MNRFFHILLILLFLSEYDKSYSQISEYSNKIGKTLIEKASAELNNNNKAECINILKSIETNHITDSSLLIRYYEVKAVASYKDSNDSISLRLLNKALDISINSNNIVKQFDIHKKIALYKIYSGDFSVSISNYFYALFIAKKLNSHKDIAHMYHNISLVLSDLEGYSMVEELLTKGRKHAQMCNDTNRIHRINCLLAIFDKKLKLKKYPGTLITNAIKYYESKNDESSFNVCIFYLGEYLYYDMKYNEAYKNLSKANKYFYDNDIKYNYAYSLQLITKCRLMLNDYTTDLQNLIMESIKLTKQLNIPNENFEARKSLARFYKETNDKRYIKALKEYRFHKDKYLKIRKKELDMVIVSNFDYRLKQLDNEKLLKSLEEQNQMISSNQIIVVLQISTICIISVLLIIILFLIICRRRQIMILNRELRFTKRLDKILYNQLSKPEEKLRKRLTLLRTGKIDANSRYELIKLSERISQGMKKSVTNLSVWAKAENKFKSFSSKQIVVADIVSNTISHFQYIITLKKIKLETDIENKIKIYMPASLFEITLQHLFDNAIKYSESGEFIKIVTKERNHKLILSISNSGDEISRFTQNYLFKHPVKSKPDTGNKTGFGLGLLLCNRICSHYHGQISYKYISDRNRFTLEFPTV